MFFFCTILCRVTGPAAAFISPRSDAPAAVECRSNTGRKSVPAPC